VSSNFDTKISHSFALKHGDLATWRNAFYKITGCFVPKATLSTQLS